MIQPGLDFEGARAERDAGIARAAEHAERDYPGWGDTAYANIAALCRAGRLGAPTLAENIRALAYAAGLPRPRDGRSWGRVFRRARDTGLIVHAGFGAAKSSNLSQKPLWQARVVSDKYTKLFSSILESTIWGEPAGTRLVWIAMLARSNMQGEVFGSVPGFARLAGVSLAECEAAIETLLAPDPYSRTPDNEGRRLAKIVGGWLILNHAKFLHMRSDAEAQERRRESKRAWDRANRPSGHGRAKQSDSSPSRSVDSPTQSDTVRQSDSGPTQSDDDPPKSVTHLDLDLEGELEQRFKSNAREKTARVEKSDRARVRLIEAAVALNAQGIRTTPSNPDLIAAIDEGVTVQELVDMARAHPQKPAGYVISAARRQRAEGARDIAPTARGSPQTPTRSKTMQAIQVLEQVKNNARLLDNTGTSLGPAETALPQSRGTAGR